MKRILIAFFFLAGCSSPVFNAAPIQRGIMLPEDSVTIEGLTFGSPEDPLSTGWALYSSGPFLEVRGCTFYLDGAHGIGFDGEGVCIVEDCIFEISDAENRYGIKIGSDAGPVSYQATALVRGNSLIAPRDPDTWKHMIFLGYGVEDALVEQNLVKGGGYGIGIKGNYRTEVRQNIVKFTRCAGIVEKAGYCCQFIGNKVEVMEGPCYRLCNDPATGRWTYGGRWEGNEGISHTFWPCFAIDSPVIPEETDTDILKNRYFIEDGHKSHAILAAWITLEEAQEFYEIEDGSEAIPIPEVKDEQ